MYKAGGPSHGSEDRDSIRAQQQRDARERQQIEQQRRIRALQEEADRLAKQGEAEKAAKKAKDEAKRALLLDAGQKNWESKYGTMSELGSEAGGCSRGRKPSRRVTFSETLQYKSPTPPKATPSSSLASSPSPRTSPAGSPVPTAQTSHAGSPPPRRASPRPVKRSTMTAGHARRLRSAPGNSQSPEGTGMLSVFKNCC